MDIWNANLFKELMERSDSGPNTPVSTTSRSFSFLYNIIYIAINILYFF